MHWTLNVTFSLVNFCYYSCSYTSSTFYCSHISADTNSVLDVVHFIYFIYATFWKLDPFPSSGISGK
jgi:hypothetical protein